MKNTLLIIYLATLGALVVFLGAENKKLSKQIETLEVDVTSHQEMVDVLYKSYWGLENATINIINRLKNLHI
jgi:prophage DNA circulation protein